MQVKKQNERKEREQKKELKEKLKTVSDYRNEARYWFQRWIRMRDVGKPCISCGAMLNDIRNFDTGHYYNAKSYPQLPLMSLTFLGNARTTAITICQGTNRI